MKDERPSCLQDTHLVMRVSDHVHVPCGHDVPCTWLFFMM